MQPNLTENANNFLCSFFLSECTSFVFVCIYLICCCCLLSNRAPQTRHQSPNVFFSKLIIMKAIALRGAYAGAHHSIPKIMLVISIPAISPQISTSDTFRSQRANIWVILIIKLELESMSSGEPIVHEDRMNTSSMRVYVHSLHDVWQNETRQECFSVHCKQLQMKTTITKHL